jgi:hypothetical protein
MYTARTFLTCAALYAAISYWWPDGGIIVWLALGTAWFTVGKISQLVASFAVGFVRNPFLDTFAKTSHQGHIDRLGGALWMLGLTLRMPLWQTAWARATSTLSSEMEVDKLQQIPFKIPSTLARYYSLGASSAVVLLGITAFTSQQPQAVTSLAVVLLAGLIAGFSAWAISPRPLVLHFRRSPGELTSKWVIVAVAAFIELAALICVVRGYRTPAAVWSVLKGLVTADWTGAFFDTSLYTKDPLNVLILFGSATYSAAVGHVLFDWLRGGLQQDDDDIVAIAISLNGVGLFDDAIAWLERIEHGSIRSAMEKATAHLGKGNIEEAARIATAAMSITEREIHRYNPLGVPTSGYGALLTSAAEIPIPSTYVVALFKRYVLTSPSDEEVTLILMTSAADIINILADSLAKDLPSQYVLTRYVCFPDQIAAASSLEPASGVAAIITAALKLRAKLSGIETFAAKRSILTEWLTTEFKAVHKAVQDELPATHDLQLAFIAMCIVLGMTLDAVVIPKYDVRAVLDLIREIETRLKGAGLKITPGMFEDSIKWQLKVLAFSGWLRSPTPSSRTLGRG